MQQQALMTFDPATGDTKPYPSHAEQWREWHGYGTAWLFNPWTGGRRSAGDVGTDVLGRLIQPPTEPLYAAQGSSNAGMATAGAERHGAGRRDPRPGPDDGRAASVAHHPCAARLKTPNVL